MKKIGVISDVHGNIQALTAALNHLENQGCREIIHTGDVLDIGANSRECLQLLLQKKRYLSVGKPRQGFCGAKLRAQAFFARFAKAQTLRFCPT